jgi:tRNA uridine 5-carboxymethylaminomethyl modification enzyme
MSYDTVARLAPPPAPVAGEVAREVQTIAQYEGYIAKQERQVERASRLEERRIPEELDYAAVVGLRNEARERLASQRPATVGQAGRMAGVNPADIAVLLVYLERGGRRRQASSAAGES